MKKVSIIFSFFTLFLGLSGTGAAAPITFADTISFTETGASSGNLIGYGGDYVSKLEKGGDYLAWAHQFTLFPSGQQILTGQVTLSVKDDETDTWIPATLEIASWAWGKTRPGILERSIPDFMFTMSMHRILKTVPLQ